MARVTIGVNDLASVHPHLVPEWDAILNGDKTPNNTSQGSDYKAHWSCPMNAVHKYQATVNKRSKGTGCPYCAGQQVLTGDNDLGTTIPLLALEWDVILNGDKTPENISRGSHYKIKPIGLVALTLGISIKQELATGVRGVVVLIVLVKRFLLVIMILGQ